MSKTSKNNNNIKYDNSNIKNNSENVLSNRKQISFSKKAGKIAGIIAICIALIVVIGHFGVTSLSKSQSNNTQAPDNLKKATSYDEIYKQLKAAQLHNYFLYENEGVSTGMLAKDSTSTTAISEDSQSSNTNSSGKDFYNTNEQTENVHEGDIVKTDGDYIYTLAYDEKKETHKIIITKADGTNLQKQSTIYFKDKKATSLSISELYVINDTLVVVGNRFNNNAKLSIPDSDDYILYDTAYAYNDFDVETVIYTYDITDRTAPKLLNTNIQDGSYNSSRLFDRYLYTVSYKPLNNFTKEACVPFVNQKLINCDGIYIPKEIKNLEYTVITSLEIDASEDFCNSLAVVGGTDYIYVSQNNIYLINNTSSDTDITDTKIGKEALAKTDIDATSPEEIKIDGDIKTALKKYYKELDVDKITAYKQSGVFRHEENISITKYSYNKEDIKFVAESSVIGSSWDNMNFDEKDGHLRLVTCSSSNTSVDTVITYYDKDKNILFKDYEYSSFVSDEPVSSNVIVLDEKLKTEAHIDNLAPGESIYSSRFLGDYGYFVTYENIDPLFSVDFSDMKNPKIIHKLKIPGFSDYLHFYTDNLLLGLGMETNESNGNWEALKLEMYDLKNGKATQKSKLVIDDYINTEATYDYKSIMIDSDKGFIGFPAYAYDTKGNSKSAYLLYTYNESGFKKLLEVKLKNDYNIRGFYIENHLYIVDVDYGISVINLDTYTSSKDIVFSKFN